MDKQNFIEAVKRYTLLFAESNDNLFTLRSGVKSSYYLDCRKLTTSSEGLFETVKMIWSAIPTKKVGREIGIKFSAIGGPCVGADYIVGALLYNGASLYNQGRVRHPLRGFGIRKEAKQHGNSPGKRVFGSVLPDDKVIVIEDVTSSGDSLMGAIDAIRDYGCEVVKAISLIDRQMGAKNLFMANDIDFQSLITIEELEIEKELERRNLK